MKSVLLFTCLLVVSLHSFSQTTTLTDQTKNNTPTCHAAAAQGGPSYCFDKLDGPKSGGAPGAPTTPPGWRSANRYSTNSAQSPDTYMFNPPGGNVNKESICNLLYPGACDPANGTRFIALMEQWWDQYSSDVTLTSGANATWKGAVGGGHVINGYDTTNSALVAAQVTNLIERGYSIQMWSDFRNDSTAQLRQSHNAAQTEIESRCTGTGSSRSCPILYAALLTNSSLRYSPSGCGDPKVIPNPNNRDSCLTSKINALLDDLRTNFFGTPDGSPQGGTKAYWRDGGRPVVMSFIAEGDWDGANWSNIWPAVSSHISGWGNNKPKLVFKDAGGFTHTLSEGAFAWVNGFNSYWFLATPGADQFNTISQDALWKSSAPSSGFYKTGQSATGKITVGAMWKGFDDAAAGWAREDGGRAGRVLSQRCGDTWLDTAGKVSDAGYSNSMQLKYLMVDTWNDYEEGTAVEPGIDNCVDISADLQNGTSTLTWSIGAKGNQNAIDHFTIYDSSDGENLTVLNTVGKMVRQQDLSGFNLSGQRKLYVQAVGVPGVLNHMSNVVIYTPAGSSLSGIVTNLGNGAALSSTTVSLSGGPSAPPSVVTGTDGAYSFANLAPGTYTVTGTHTGFKQRSYQVDVPAGTPATKNIQLSTTGRISGTATDVNTGAALSGVTVNASGGPYPSDENTTTDASGNYTTTFLPIGSYAVTCTLVGYANYTVPSSVTVTTGNITSGINCPMTNHGSISGVVTDLNNPTRLLDNVTVTDGTRSFITGTDGAYTLADVPPGSYTVTATRTGFQMRSYFNVQVNGGQAVTKDIQMTTTGRISGAVRAPSGATIAGATILFAGGNLYNETNTTSNSSGSYISGWIPIGTYTVTCQAAGFPDKVYTGVSVTTPGSTVTQNCQF